MMDIALKVLSATTTVGISVPGILSGSYIFFGSTLAVLQTGFLIIAMFVASCFDFFCGGGPSATELVGSSG